MLAGLAATDAAVATGIGVTVTLTAPDELLKLPEAVNAAVIVSLPTAKLGPFTDTVATPADTEADPSKVDPSENVTAPVGASDPETANTLAVKVVDPAVRMLVGKAVTEVVVPTPAGDAAHFVTSTFASTDPRPVTRS
jgi:hypothetical protein